MMAQMLQSEQQVVEVSEGMFEWKLDGFLQTDRDIRNSSTFKIGRIDGFLQINYNISDYSTDRNVRLVKHFIIYMELLGKNVFSKEIYIKGGLISGNGSIYFSKEHFLDFEIKCFPVMSDSDTSFYTMLKKSPELFPDGILTFRLVWSDEKSRLDSLMELTTSPDQEKIPRKSLEELSKDFEDFFESKTNTDCVLMVGDEQFPVHRVVLSARSSVFAAIFRHDTLENRNGVVNISDIDVGIMSDVLHYVYTGQIRRLDAETAAKMYIVANRYALMELKDDCLEFLMRNLTMENFVDAIKLAHVYGVSALEKKIIQFMAENAEKLPDNIAWKEFSRTYPSQGLKYIESALTIKHNTRT